MDGRDSVLDLEAMARARRLLARPVAVQRTWPVLTAAAFLAMASLVFAAAMITAPPVITQHIAGAPG